MSNVSNLKFKDGDGDDGRSYGIDQVRIKEVHNGWIVETLYDDDGGEYTSVFNNSDELWDHLKKVFKI